ncbi:MAG: hypothetical protein HKL81_08160 [Acidimicrobiaceae bacterium]|nr:hypothetical protein [Acidimicrobiaceae bacterium]
MSNGLGGSIGLTIPLVVGVILKHPADGAISSVGALLAGLVASQGYHRTRVQALAWEAVLMSLMSFGGAMLSSNTVVFAIFAAISAAFAGMSLTLGPTFSIVIIEAVLQMAVSSAFQLDFKQALVRSVYVFLGVILQLVIVMISWAFGIGKQEFSTVSKLFGILAKYTEAVVTDAQLPQPPVFFDYQSALGDPNPFLSQAKLSLINSQASEAEQVRVNLVAFVNLTRPLTRDPLLNEAVTSILNRARDALARAANSVLWETKERGLTREFTMGIDSFSGTLAILEALNAPDRLVVTKLLRQLSRIGLVTDSDLTVEEPNFNPKRIRRWRPSIRDDLSAAKAVIVANINLESDAFRHAIRLVIATFLSVLVTREAHISRGYWVFLTVIVVLKPDYATTIRRGVERTIGTVVGVGLAVAVVGGLKMSDYQLIPLIFLLAIGAYWVFRANYATFVILLTVLVVALLEIAGLGVVVTAKARLSDTLIGGVVAIGVYLIWPTWGKSNMYVKMAQLLAAQRSYASALIEATINGETHLNNLNNLLIRARSSRIVAEGALERVSYEPKQQVLGYVKRAQFVASARLFAGACLSLHAACNSATAVMFSDETRGDLEEVSSLIQRFYTQFIEVLEGSKLAAGVDIDIARLEKLSNKVAQDLGRGPRRGSLVALALLEMTDAVRSIDDLLSYVMSQD